MNLMLNLAVAAAPSAPASSAHAAGSGGDTDAAAFSHCLEDACATPPPMPAAKAKPAAAPPAKPKAAPSDPAIDLAAPPAPAHAAIESLPVEAALATDALPADEALEASPDLAALLPGWAPPAAAPAATPTAPPTAGPVDVSEESTPSKGTAAALATEAPRSATAARVLEAVARETPRREAAQAEAVAAPPATPPLHTDPVRPQTTATLTPRTVPEPTAPPVLPPALAAAPATPTMPTAQPVPSAALAPPPQHPDFAPALAVQVRWWADAGVQQAQLTLNPAEMGPVAVRIVVNEAREARIDFSADLAATRQALEASLPALAAALDESGLTLTGGGVHDGANQRQGAWEHARAQAQAARPFTTLPEEKPVNDRTPTRPGAAARGIVDLVA